MATMTDFDEHGMAPIHKAASHGFVRSIERYVTAVPEHLELETTDEFHSTPFLLAVASGKEETVNCLLQLGAKINVINAHNHGAIEICALKQLIPLLQYFIKLNDDSLPVWKNLLRFLANDSEEEADAAGKCLRTLTQGSADEGLNPNWEHVYNNGGVPTIIKVAKSTINDESKVPAFQTLMNMIEKEEVKEQVISSGGIPAFIRLLKSESKFAVQLCAQILKELALVKQYADQMVQNNAIPSLLKVIQTLHDPEVLVEVMDAMGNIAAADFKHQSTIGSTNGCIQAIVGLFEEQKERALLSSLSRAVSHIAKNEQSNQNLFVELGVTPYIVALTRNRHKELQLSAVEAIHRLVENNPQTQRAVLEKSSAQSLLMVLLQKSRAEVVQEKTAMALWALAGQNINAQRRMAEKMGVNMLIDFLNSASENLHFIGSEGMGVLAQGPLNYQTEIGAANGIHPLVRLLRSDKEHIVLSVIRTMRHLCVGVAFVPHRKNQLMISQSRGVKFLVALMVHSQNDLIQVESALTLGCVSLGNIDILDEIHANVDFSYVRILKMMYSRQEIVRLHAGGALAAFAYNNIGQQREIAEQGGVRFNCFIPFLQSDDEYYRCNSAFQVVVLARIIPDEEQALSSAAGIKLLVDLLQDSRSDEILGLAADCLARLAHTRAGVPAAILSISAISYLCDLLLSQADQVRGCAAIALGYLSYDHTGERQLLARCRGDPYLMKVLLYYTKMYKLSPSFREAWRHFKRIGLPKIPEGRPCLVQSQMSDQEYDENARPITILSIEDTSNSSNLRSPASNPTEDGQYTGRSSRSSRLTNHTGASLQNSQLSLEGSRSQQSLVASNPEIMVEAVEG